MKRTDNPQVNSRVYWDYIYKTPARNKEYWGRTNRFFNALEYVKDNQKFLDLGCGVGIPCRMVLEKKKNCEAWGVDISEQVIEQNKHDVPQGKWFQGYIGSLTFLPTDYFDVVFCGETIEHLDDPNDAFKEAHRVLKKKGIFIITTPIEDHIHSPEHVWEYTSDDIERMYKENKFSKTEFIMLPDMEHLYVFFALGIK